MSIARLISFGLVGALALLFIYFSVVSAISGFDYARDQFGRFWIYIVVLASGFGLQVSLYLYLKSMVSDAHSGAVVVSGTSSAAAMVTCCLHYAANLLPVLALSGAASFVSAYQTEFFGAGIVINLAALIFMLSKIRKAKEAYVHH